MKEKSDIEIKIKLFLWINDKYFNELENSSGQVASLHIKTKVPNNAHMTERLGKFEILEAKLRDEVMTNQ